MAYAKKGLSVVPLGLGVLVGCIIANPQAWTPRLLKHAVAQDPGSDNQSKLALLQADVEILKQKATDQAHVMTSVAYHFSNLWFAGQQNNWPLAQFYWNEARSHLRWAVRVIPIRQDSSGEEIKLGEILQAMENSPLAQLQSAIEAKDHDKFVAAYRFSLETCYACHKAVEKPFLHLQIPTHPAEPTINFDPEPSWPR